MTEQTPPPPQSRRWPWLCAIFVLLAFYAWELWRTAWIGDDAYITLRTVDNFVHGHGLRWNIGERVQSYTHPLWMFLLSACYFLTREEFYTTIALSALCSLAAAALLMFGLTRNWREALLAGVCLIASKAFVDYSTSGLENPLTHLIFVVYFLVYLRETAEHRNARLFALALLAGLGMLNRLDTALVFGPPLLWAWWLCRGWKTLAIAAAGFVPLALWEVFSLFYYGFPFPNTAYAKLSGDVPWHFKPVFAFKYFYHTLRIDPQTLFVIATGIVFVFRARVWRLAPLAVGVALYMLYVFKIGGDFMSGRFFALPMLVALCLLLNSGFAASGRRMGTLAAAVLAFGLIMPLTPIFSGKDYFEKYKWFGSYKGITDERGFYYSNSGLLPSFENDPYPNHWYANFARTLRARRGEQHTVTDLGSIGFSGFLLGPHYHLVDHYGLADAVLARQLTVGLKYWRPGHSTRAIPQGYLETLLYGKNQIADPDLAQWYEALEVVIKGPLLAEGRLGNIIGFNTGRYDHLLANAHEQQRELRRKQEENEVDIIFWRNQEHLRFRAKWDDTVTTDMIEKGILQSP